MQGVDFEHFNLDVELQKIPVEDRERFQIGLITETVLAAECRMLGWLHQCLFGEPCAPTKRVSAQGSTAPLRPSPTSTEELQDLPF
jgi:hypothetical protein